MYIFKIMFKIGKIGNNKSFQITVIIAKVILVRWNNVLAALNSNNVI